LGKVDAHDGIWVGSLEGERAVVDLDLPVFLWPMMERPLVDVIRELSARWSAFDLPHISVDDLVCRILISALKSERVYWEDLALDWIESAFENNLAITGSWVAVIRRVGDSLSSQQGRHRARRLLRQLE
jgi:hypothetical protein